jgi:hypothetical protein
VGLKSIQPAGTKTFGLVVVAVLTLLLLGCTRSRLSSIFHDLRLLDYQTLIVIVNHHFNPNSETVQIASRRSAF